LGQSFAYDGARVIAEGKVRTYDMGGKASTLDMAKAVADYATA
jgi:isocitrate/isopropylmalate dehydrogenase